MKIISTIFTIFLIVNCSFNAIATQTKEDNEYRYNYQLDDCIDVYDPYEKLNRKIFAFNSFLDHILLRPIAVTYKNVTNDYTKTRVRNFLENISVPLSSVNYGLQMDFNNSMRSVWRFLINSTFGVVGLFDIASKVGLTPSYQTFGNTLAHYGVGPGPYLVVPFFGGTNARDVTDLFTNNAFNPIKYSMHSDLKLALLGAGTISDRTTILPFTDYVAKSSTDPYVAIRTAIHQNRESKVKYPEGYDCPDVPSK
jgi:phospholipid-binding lipoprotein MlaA